MSRGLAKSGRSQPLRVMGFAWLTCLVACNDVGVESEVGVQSQEYRRLTHALKQIEAYAEEGMDRWQVPGLAIGIIKDGEPIYTAGFGYRDLEQKLEVTTRTNFSLASMTKAFTALTAGLMVQDGTIDFDMPIRDRVPEFTLSSEELTASVTLRDILSHRTGLADKSSLWTTGENSAQEIFDRLEELEVVGPRGKFFDYSNVLYIAAAVIISEVMEKPWDAVASERLLEPLGMSESGLSLGELQQSAEYSYSYGVTDGESFTYQFPGPEHNVLYFPRGSGSMYSNVEDMTKWMMFHLGDGNFEGQRIVDTKTLVATREPSIQIADPPFYVDYPGISNQSYAMGWYVDDYHGYRRIHHDGSSWGYSGNIVLFPDDKIGIVVLGNRESLMAIEMSNIVSDLMLGLDVQDWKGRFSAYVPAE